MPCYNGLAMRDISSLTLVLNEQCNFSCAYCPQRQGKNTLTIAAIKTFLDFLGPRLADEVWLGFYGGEPLLSWPLIEKTVAYSDKKFKNRFRFTLTTNGSLLKKEHILFFRKHQFDLVLSYDGLAQKYRDSGSVAAVEAALADLQELYPQGYTVNSVFTPRTVPLLAASIEAMLKQGHQRLQYNLDLSVPWQEGDLAALDEQLDRLVDICLEHRQKTGTMALENFKAPDGKGSLRLLSPAATAWPCSLTKPSGAATCSTICLAIPGKVPITQSTVSGKLEDFMSVSKTTLAAMTANYAELRQDYFFSEKKGIMQPVPRPGKLRPVPGNGRPGQRHPGRDPKLDLRGEKDRPPGPGQTWRCPEQVKPAPARIPCLIPPS